MTVEEEAASSSPLFEFQTGDNHHEGEGAATCTVYDTGARYNSRCLSVKCFSTHSVYNSIKPRCFASAARPTPGSCVWGKNIQKYVERARGIKIVRIEVESEEINSLCHSARDVQRYVFTHTISLKLTISC